MASCAQGSKPASTEGFFAKSVKNPLFQDEGESADQFTFGATAVNVSPVALSYVVLQTLVLHISMSSACKRAVENHKLQHILQDYMKIWLWPYAFTRISICRASVCILKCSRFLLHFVLLLMHAFEGLCHSSKRIASCTCCWSRCCQSFSKALTVQRTVVICT